MPGPLSYAALKEHLERNKDPDRPEDRVWLYHAHTHYKLGSQEAFDAATKFKEDMQARFNPEEAERFFYGRLHTRPVGPHPEGQFELVFTRADFAEVINWLALARPPLVSIFIHPHTLELLEDHTHRAMWLGPPNKLVTGILKSVSERWRKEIADGAQEADILWGRHQ